MAEDATRKLLKLFGIALTNFEDQTAKGLEPLNAPGLPAHSLAATLALAEEWLAANGEAATRWLEVTQWLVGMQAKTQAELLRALAAVRERHGSGEPDASPPVPQHATPELPGREMDAKAREELEAAVQALDEALSGLINFMMTLRPTLRNEIMQICGHHIETARRAKERLEALLQE
jgi:hypothetical protein